MSLLVARALTKSFRWKSRFGRLRRLVALDRVDVEVGRGECFAVVGESGSGKTTLGRCLIRLHEADSGQVFFDGKNVLELSSKELRRLRRDVQMVFQDSGSAFNPRQRVREILSEPLEIHGLSGGEEALAARLRDLLSKVGLGESTLQRYAHQLSGGQRQRLGIARALAVEPRLLVLDEPVAALDVSVQARILSLLEQLRSELGLAMILISHDLAVVRQIAERVGVLYLGRLVEEGPAEQVFTRPSHPYTAGLLEAVPVPDPARQSLAKVGLTGEIPSALSPPSGCRFHPRCPLATACCRSEEPLLRRVRAAGSVACHHAEDFAAARRAETNI